MWWRAPGRPGKDPVLSPARVPLAASHQAEVPVQFPAVRVAQQAQQLVGLRLPPGPGEHRRDRYDTAAGQSPALGERHQFGEVAQGRMGVHPPLGADGFHQDLRLFAGVARRCARQVQTVHCLVPLAMDLCLSRGLPQYSRLPGLRRDSGGENVLGYLACGRASLMQQPRRRPMEVHALPESGVLQDHGTDRRVPESTVRGQPDRLDQLNGVRCLGRLDPAQGAQQRDRHTTAEDRHGSGDPFEIGHIAVADQQLHHLPEALSLVQPLLRRMSRPRQSLHALGDSRQQARVPPVSSMASFT